MGLDNAEVQSSLAIALALQPKNFAGLQHFVQVFVTCEKDANKFVGFVEAAQRVTKDVRKMERGCIVTE